MISVADKVDAIQAKGNGWERRGRTVVGLDGSNLRTGGSLTHLREILAHAPGLRGKMGRLIVWTNAETARELGDHDQPVEIRIVPALSRGLLVRKVWQDFTLSRQARVECDILFNPGCGFNGSFRPYITMSRNLLPYQPREYGRYGAHPLFFKYRTLRFLQNRCFRHAAGVIFLTQYARTEVQRFCGDIPGRKALIPHGVNPMFYRDPAAVTAPTGETAETRILYVSTVDAYKHQWNVVEAVGSLRRRGWPVRLDLYGRAEIHSLRRLRRAIEKEDAAGIFIRYHGAAGYSELKDIYRSSDVFVFASTCENMPNILVEAMASRLPIASARAGPMPEILQDGGIYFDAESSASIAASIELYLGSAELRRSMATRAHELSRVYSWKRCAEQTFEFITGGRGLPDQFSMNRRSG